MLIIFDPAKSARNERERGLPFGRAADFDWGGALLLEDTRRDYGERRIVATGPLDDRIHVLCFVPIPGGIRVISLRKANLREVRNHEKATASDQ